MNEFEIIAEIFAPLARDPGAFGLKDDAAVIAPRPGFDLIVTTDQIAEGTDFFAHDPAGTVAKKALRVNLSDLAAKGAKPEFYLLTVALPAGMTMEWLKGFAAGLQADQEKFGISLLGGDTGRSEGPLSITITAFGFVPEGQMIRRSGARPGDDVYVTGTIGDSGGGLAVFKREKHSLSEQDRDYLTTRYRLPEPPVALGEKLRGLASASVDISDGLIADLGHLAGASGVRILVEGEKVPLSAPLRALWGDRTLLRAVSAGDDYQIAFTASPGLDGPFTQIGRVEAGEGVVLTLAGREISVLPGYRHF
jgi:thiamine-monophosphate kinase